MKAFVLLFVVFTVATVCASEEEFAIWSSAEIATVEIPRVGRVSVSAKTDSGRISRLVIVAFDRTHNVVGDDLKRIADFPLSSMRLTHEAGYEILGGYTVHLKLRRSYYDSNKKLRDETAIVSVTEKNGLRKIDLTDTK